MITVDDATLESRVVLATEIIVCGSLNSTPACDLEDAWNNQPRLMEAAIRAVLTAVDTIRKDVANAS